MSILKSKEIFEETFRKNNSIIEIKDELLLNLQKIELQMFKNINDMCYENDIDLLLGGGTLLGAIRHKGFIPWDDDIDLNLQRKFVDRFIKIVEDKYSDIYEVQYNNKKQNRPFIKIRKKGTILYEPDAICKNEGVSIDVFIIEDLPTKKIMIYLYGIICTIKLFIASCSAIYEIDNDEFCSIMKSSIKSNINYHIKKIIGYMFSYTSYNKRVVNNNTYFSKYYRNQSKYICIPTGRKHFFGELYKREIFENVKESEFEGIKCKIPKDYDSYLINLYGKNYMEIPPENKREHHYVFDIKL